MCDWVLLGEQTEVGIVFQLGMNRATGRYFRFEPLATRLRGNAAGALRQRFETRKLVKEDLKPAIIPVIGPIFNQDRYWLGWQDRNGQYLLESMPKIKKPIKEELADLYPLIYSYSLWHQASLIVGRPEWRRLSKDGNGIFMPDPKPLFYLAQPDFNPETALERCRPSEEYRNQPLNFSGDVFYLGLIIYYYITEMLPFPLHKGWPTWAIIKGDIINPQLYRPDLPSGLGRMILSMLDPEPLQRPTIAAVKELWNSYCSKTDPLIIESNWKENLQKRPRFKRTQVFTKAISQWAIPICLLVLLIMGLYFCYPEFINHSNTHPLKAAADFYQEMERVNLHSREVSSAQSLSSDFRQAAKRRLEMVAALLSKPLFKVDRMRLVDETSESVIIEADLIWWEWSVEGWVRRTVLERLEFQKKGKKLELIKRNQVQE